ncbi:MAG: hypothetical protein HY598_02730 [Candidatus Omnitrophica bacterium]|nr:hypothetical protein [Candidatus Omnitrophota bacterium]
MPSISASPSAPTLLEGVEPARWQRLQDRLAHVLGVPIRTVGLSRELLVPPSWPSSLVNDQTIALLRAGEELEQLIPSGQLLREVASVTTTLGATYAAVPMRAAPELILAYVVIGPIVVGVREEELQFRQRVHAMGLDASALWPLMLSLRLYSFSGLRALLDLIEDLTGLLAEMAYRKTGDGSHFPVGSMPGK